MKMNEFDTRRLNESLAEQKSRSEKMLKNTMASSKFDKRHSMGEFTSTINQDLSELRRTKSNLESTRKLISTGKFDPGYFTVFEDPSTISKIKYMDHNTFTDYMKLEEKTLND